LLVEKTVYNDLDSAIAFSFCTLVMERENQITDYDNGFTASGPVAADRHSKETHSSEHPACIK
jgi:hypothetical protein